MTNPSSDVLERCPFCGDEAFIVELNDARQVWCTRDLCARGPFRGNRVAAIEAWNARAESKATVERLSAERLQLFTAMKDFIAGADAGFVSIEVDNAVRAALTTVENSAA